MPPTVSLHLPSRLPEAGELPPARAFARVLGRAGAATGEIALVLVDAGEIRRLNREFRGKDRATDVLSFDYREPGDGRDVRDVWGDVYVSDEAARDQAHERGIPFPEELARLFLHGALHLLGFRDDTPQELERMTGVQEELLEQLLGPSR
ncbi:MAG: rRNA maturation RNase YbeY [Gemmatimonadota bacterium]